MKAAPYGDGKINKKKLMHCMGKNCYHSGRISSRVILWQQAKQYMIFGENPSHTFPWSLIPPQKMIHFLKFDLEPPTIGGL